MTEFAGKLLGYQAVRIQAASERLESEEGLTLPDGIRLRVRSLRIDPTEIRGGEYVAIELEYELGLPVGKDARRIQESFQLARNGSSFVLTGTRTNVREAGHWRIRASFQIPHDVLPGEYVLRSRVGTDSGFEVREIPVRVV